ncbi:MAG: glycosyltransferase [Candidatus Omnitrophica bacterium]|nr:glycosyltransferase [Candidatus Omnitrophota bacterium]
MAIKNLNDIPVYEPAVSIIIPTWRHSAVLKKCLASLERLDYPRDKIEVILISKDPVEAEIKTALTIKCLSAHYGHNHARMRNDAAKAASGEMLAFIDDDVSVKSDWLTSGMRYFFIPGAGAIGGPGTAPAAMSFSERCAYYTLASPFASGFTYMRYFNMGTLYQAGENDLILCNNMIKKDCFIKAGGFHERQVPCEENELYRRIIDAGYKLFYVPDIEVEHKVKPVFVMIMKAYWYGTGRGGFIVRVPKDNRKPRIFIPSLSLIFIATFGSLSFFSVPARELFILYLLIYAGNMAGHIVFVFRKFTKNPIFWVCLPPVTVLFQHAYGLGVIVGIVKTLIAKNKHGKMSSYFRKY